MYLINWNLRYEELYNYDWYLHFFKQSIVDNCSLITFYRQTVPGFVEDQVLI